MTFTPTPGVTYPDPAKVDLTGATPAAQRFAEWCDHHPISGGYRLGLPDGAQLLFDVTAELHEAVDLSDTFTNSTYTKQPKIIRPKASTVREEAYLRLCGGTGYKLGTVFVVGSEWPNPPVYVASKEVQHGLDVCCGVTAQVDKLQVRGVAGDFAYVGSVNDTAAWNVPAALTIDEVACNGAGRQMLSCCFGYLTVNGGTMINGARSRLDCEVLEAPGFADVSLANVTAYNYHLSFISAGNCGGKVTVVETGSRTNCALFVYHRPVAGVRGAGWSLTNCVSPYGYGSPIDLFDVTDVDGFTVSGWSEPTYIGPPNYRVPQTDKGLTRQLTASGCTGVTFTNNDWE